MAGTATPQQLKTEVRRHVSSLGGLQRVRFIRQGEFTIAIAVLKDGRLAAGVTLCSREDTYDESYGRLLALRRLAPTGSHAWVD